MTRVLKEIEENTGFLEEGRGDFGPTGRGEITQNAVPKTQGKGGHLWTKF